MKFILLLMFCIVLSTVALAHAGEEHASSEEEERHIFEVRAYQAGSVLVVLAIIYGLKRISKRKKSQKAETFIVILRGIMLASLVASALVYIFAGPAVLFLWLVALLAVFFFVFYLSLREAN